jgi:cell division septation protein DedD
MAKNGNGGSGKNGSLVAGIMLGMILGVAAAGGVAWYIMNKNPEAFHPRESQREAPRMALPASAPVVISAVPEVKPHFEFYKTLPDTLEVTPGRKNVEKGASRESHPAPVATPHLVAKSQPVASVTSRETYFVQAGSFQNPADAEKLKAKLAMIGMEANVQTVSLPEKGMWHRVRLGPYKGQDEANNAVNQLKQNGVANATSARIQ